MFGQTTFLNGDFNHEPLEKKHSANQRSYSEASILKERKPMPKNLPSIVFIGFVKQREI